MGAPAEGLDRLRAALGGKLRAMRRLLDELDRLGPVDADRAG